MNVYILLISIPQVMAIVQASMCDWLTTRRLLVLFQPSEHLSIIKSCKYKLSKPSTSCKSQCTHSYSYPPKELLTVLLLHSFSNHRPAQLSRWIHSYRKPLRDWISIFPAHCEISRSCFSKLNPLPGRLRIL